MQVMVYILVVIGGIIDGTNTTFAQDTGASGNTASNKVRHILLDTNVKESPPKHEQIRRLVESGSLDSATLGTLLKGWASIDPDKANDAEEQLLHASVEVMGWLSSDETKETLLRIAKERSGNLRRRALRSLVRMNPKCELGPDISKMMDNTRQYDDLDRRSVYEAFLEKARQLSRNDNGRQNGVEVVTVLFEKEPDNGNRILLDKFLSDESSEYRLTPARRTWLAQLEKSTITSYREYAIENRKAP